MLQECDGGESTPARDDPSVSAPDFQSGERILNPRKYFIFQSQGFRVCVRTSETGAPRLPLKAMGFASSHPRSNPLDIPFSRWRLFPQPAFSRHRNSIQVPMRRSIHIRKVRDVFAGHQQGTVHRLGARHFIRFCPCLDSSRRKRGQALPGTNWNRQASPRTCLCRRFHRNEKEPSTRRPCRHAVTCADA